MTVLCHWPKILVFERLKKFKNQRFIPVLFIQVPTYWHKSKASSIINSNLLYCFLPCFEATRPNLKSINKQSKRQNSFFIETSFIVNMKHFWIRI